MDICRWVQMDLDGYTEYTVYICFVFSHVLIWTPKKKTSYDLVAIPYLKSWSVGACFDQHGTNKPINIGGHTKMKRTSSFLDSVDFLKHKLLESGNCFLFWKKWMLESQVRDYLCDDRPVITNAYLRKNAFHTLKVQNRYEIKLESLLMSEGFLNRHVNKI